MLIYWVVFFILFLFSYVELISARQSLVLLRCVILFIACMVGFRYNIGADWETYVIIYNRQIPSLLDPEYRILMEPLFWILGSLCKTLGLSYACFFIILSLISFVVLFIVIRRIGCGYIYLPILLYFCLFFCQFQLNIVRHGIMASFVWLAFSYIKECSLKKFVFFLLIAAGFQLAALAFFPFYFLLNRCYMQKSVVTLIFISLIFVMLGVSQKILLLGTKIPVFGEFVNYYILDFYGRNVDASYFNKDRDWFIQADTEEITTFFADDPIYKLEMLTELIYRDARRLTDAGIQAILYRKIIELYEVIDIRSQEFSMDRMNRTTELKQWLTTYEYKS